MAAQASEQAVEAWDLFISHASEDKADFVTPLASALSDFGVRVWYDDFTLSLGDSLSRTIDKGLAKSNFGLVVLSPAFFAKKWPEYELGGLTAREISGRKVILPVWHNVSRDDVLEFSPPLADKIAIRSDGLKPSQIAVRVIEEVRPDIFTRILRRMAFYAARDRAITRQIPLEDIKQGPILHPELPTELISRIRLIRACLLGVYPHTMEFWMDGFKRDSHPSQEILYWERFSARCTASTRQWCLVCPPNRGQTFSR